MDLTSIIKLTAFSKYIFQTTADAETLFFQWYVDL